MRIWKLACLAILCCFLLVGCTPTQSGDTAKADKAPQAQVEMAVPKQGIPVLMYHMIGDVPDNDAVLLESHFREQMKFLKDNDFHPITMDQLYDYMVHDKPVPVRPGRLPPHDGHLSGRPPSTGRSGPTARSLLAPRPAGVWAEVLAAVRWKTDPGDPQ